MSRRGLVGLVAPRRAALTLPDCLGDEFRYAFHHDDFDFYRDFYLAADTG